MIFHNPVCTYICVVVVNVLCYCFAVYQFVYVCTIYIDLRLSLINDVLGPLMNTSADLTINSADEFRGDLDRIREEILYNINSTIAGNSDFNLTAEFIRFFIEGLSTFYYNVSFESSSAPAIFNPHETQRNCAINAIYTHFYSMMDEAEIAALGGRLQQIAVAFDVARAVSVLIMLISMYVHHIYCGSHLEVVVAETV